MRGFFSFVFPFFLLAAACSGSSGGSVTSTSSSTPSADLTGHWVGHATALGQTISVISDLEQNGSSLGGTMRSPGGCIGGGKVSGTVSGDEATATVTAGSVVATMTLTISSDDQLDGTFAIPESGACPAQEGSVSLTRK